MRHWLLFLTLVVLVLGAALAVTYTDLTQRLQQVEEQVADPPEPPPVELREANVYFSRLVDQDVEIVPVSRLVPASAPAAGAVRELLRGPTAEEREEGLGTEIPPGVEIRRVTIQDRTARAVFSEELDRGVAGSLRVTTIRGQIETTLRQFPTVDRVIIEINGRVNDVLQP